MMPGRTRHEREVGTRRSGFPTRGNDALPLDGSLPFEIHTLPFHSPHTQSPIEGLFSAMPLSSLPSQPTDHSEKLPSSFL
jgi:hypothetical protein